MKVISVEEEYQKNKDLKPEDVKNLLNWVKLQPHLPEISELEIILFLHSCYYKQEAAKTTIDNYYTCRTLCPEFFSNRNPNNNLQLQTALNTGLYYKLPGCTKEGYEVIYCVLYDPDPNKYHFAENLKLFTIMVDLWLLRGGCKPGQLIVMDMFQSSIGHIPKVGLMTMKKYCYYLQEAMPLRLKGVHIINALPFVDTVLSMVKPFLKKELMDLVHIHANGMDSVYKVIPKENLPKELNGEAPSRKEMQQEMIEDVKNNYQYFEEEETKRVDETKRPDKAKNVGNIFGVEGTFKKLDID